MTLPVIVLPAAETDIRDAIDYYDGLRPGSGELFRLEVDRAIALVRRWPEGYERVTPRLRRAVLHRFWYAVIYRPLPQAVRIVGVISTRRDPAVVAGLEQSEPD
ncbi:MAG: type II toxin-antitoxin system RelE/ParE family toxin [Phycisphaerales bacterium]|nr:type II toxin-antitoxin system RelE/ParE family toxin [Phycisphaerales bacterium]